MGYLWLLFLLLFLPEFKWFLKIDKDILNAVSTTRTNDYIPVIITSESKRELYEKVEELITKYSGKIKYHLPIIHGYAVEIPANRIKDIANTPCVKYIHYDATVNCLLNIATKAIKADIAHEFGYTGKKVTVAVVDTGIYPHPDLTKPENRIIAFKDFVNNKTSPYDDNGHGTHVAGEIAGNGLSSGGKYRGVAPNAKLVGVKVLNQEGGGNISDVIAGVQWVVENKDKYNIKVMNLSLGAEPRPFADPLVSAVNTAWKKGIVVVAAAGNSGPKKGTISSPGISPTIITVGAVDDKRTPETSDDTIANFSSRGPTPSGKIKPDVVAPGVNITSLNSDKSYLPGETSSIMDLKEAYISKSGTSMATPIVAGAIALLLEKYPELTPDKVKEMLKKSAVDLKAESIAQGAGEINIAKLLNL